METRFGRKWRLSAARALETFLVEWKLRELLLPRPLGGCLETFLVEWKLFWGLVNTVVVWVLETFLVEWKPHVPNLALVPVFP